MLHKKNYFVITGIFILVASPFIPLMIYTLAHKWDWPYMVPNEWWLIERAEGTSLRSWDYVFSPYSHIVKAFFNTIFIAVCTTAISFCVCLSAARVLAHEKIKGKEFIELLISSPLILPEIIIAGGTLLLMIRMGLAGSYLGIIIVHLIPCIPYMLRILTAMFQGYSIDCEEQARVLGANRLTVFWKITLPILSPGIIAACLFSFLVSSSIFLLTFLVGQGRVEVMSTILFSHIGGGIMNAEVAAITLLMALPGLVFLLLTEHYISETHL